MTEEQFWELLRAAGDPTSQLPQSICDDLTSRLAGSDSSELAAFENVRARLLRTAYTWPMLKACYVTIGYVSDDVFEDFRHWVMLHGRDRFFATVADPDQLASYAVVNDPVEEVTGEPLMFVCENAWEGDIDDVESQVVYPKPPVIDDEWPSEHALKQEFPRLYGRFRENRKSND